MKINEIINEDMSAGEQLGGGSLVANLVPVLMFLKNRSEDRDLSPKIRTDSLIQLVQNAGDRTFTYQDLVAAHENDPAVKELIKDFNENEVIVKSTSEEAAELKQDNEENDEGGDDQADHQAVVASMAKRAAST